MDDTRAGEMDSEDIEIVKFSGATDFLNEEEFRAALERAIDGCRGMSIDLSDTKSLDSSALSGLLGAYTHAGESGVEVKLESLSDHLTRIMQASGMAQSFGLAPLRMSEARPIPDKSELRRQQWKITESVILAEPELTATLRDMAVAAALETGMDEESVLDVRLAAGEALADALGRSSTGPESRITLRCMACEKAFVMEVIDNGASETSDDGLGMKLIKAAMDEVDVSNVNRGYCVRMLKWLPGAGCEV
jgi:anti-anti-sigma factor